MAYPRLVVFGATGRTGEEVVRSAVHRGIPVTVFCRPTSKTPAAWRQPEVTVCRGDLLCEEDLRSALSEGTAVVIAIGARPPYKDVFAARATEAILGAAAQVGVDRVVCVTGAAVGRDLRHCRWAFRTLARLIERRNPALAEDRHRQDEIVSASLLRWTLVRPPRLIDGEATGQVRDGEALRVGLLSHIHRADLADFIVRETFEPRHIQERVQVAGG